MEWEEFTKAFQEKTHNGHRVATIQVNGASIWASSFEEHPLFGTVYLKRGKNVTAVVLVEEIQQVW